MNERIGRSNCKSHLVDNPDEVAVTETAGWQRQLLLKLKVAPSDMGKVIGKQGQNCKSDSFRCKSCSLKRRQEELLWTFCS